MATFVLRAVSLLVALVPTGAFAQTVTLDITSLAFGDRTFSEIMSNILTVAQGAVVLVATVVFVAGGVMFIISGGNEDKKSRGKDLMFGSLIGLGIIIGAKGIMNISYFFVYGG